jgi:hypothetical protein
VLRPTGSLLGGLRILWVNLFEVGHMQHMSWLFPVVMVSLLGSGTRAADLADAWIINDPDKALKEAKKTGKPVFVVFRCER